VRWSIGDRGKFDLGAGLVDCPDASQPANAQRTLVALCAALLVARSVLVVRRESLCLRCSDQTPDDLPQLSRGERIVDVGIDRRSRLGSLELGSEKAD
jgi:hypothetical protein